MSGEPALLTITWTVLPASAVPDSVGVLSLVNPVGGTTSFVRSFRTAESVTEGACVSTVTAKAAEGAPVLPAGSVLVAVKG